MNETSVASFPLYSLRRKRNRSLSTNPYLCCFFFLLDRGDVSRNAFRLQKEANFIKRCHWDNGTQFLSIAVILIDQINTISPREKRAQREKKTEH